MATESNTIVLRGNFDPYEEGRAGVAITPGMHIEKYSGGLRPATVVGKTPPLFAIEDAMVGPMPNAGYTRGNTIDDDYAIGDLVRYVHAQGGDRIFALLAAGENATAAGVPLEPNGDGSFAVAANFTTAVCTAEEVVNNTAGSDPVRIAVKVIG
jgi:hypothetical protein